MTILVKFIVAYLIFCMINTILARIVEKRILKEDYDEVAALLYFPVIHVITTIYYIIQILDRWVLIKIIDWINKSK